MIQNVYKHILLYLFMVFTLTACGSNEIQDRNTTAIGTNELNDTVTTYSQSNDTNSSSADKTKPTLTLEGESEISLAVGASYSDAGAKAEDSVDGDLTESIQVNTTVDTNKVGTYTITYDVKDSAGNPAEQVSRTVTVSDSEKPVITLVGDTPQKIEVGTNYTELGATVKDNYDTNLSEKLIIDTSAVDTNKVGTYRVTYNLEDASGNKAEEVIRTVEITADKTKPTLTLEGESEISLAVGASYSDAGAKAEDSVDGDLTESIQVNTTVDTNKVGTYTITYDVKDSEGNEAVQLTRTVNVVLKIFRLKSESQDRNADGDSDAILSYTYDDKGNKLTYSYDGNADGDAESMSIYTYDDKGKKLTYSLDKNADGDADTIYTYTYDEKGNKLTDSSDENADGVADTNKIMTYTYDDKDNILTYRYDNNGDGVTDFATTYTYDEKGNKLTSSYDNNADGVLDTVYTYTYDEKGNKLTSSYDKNGDGVAESISTYTYDEKGNKLTYSYDKNGDGVADTTYTYTYDEKGNKLTDRYDKDADGNPESVSTYTYDKYGNILMKSQYKDGDSETVSITTYSYTYDEYGNILTKSEDQDEDGEPESIMTYTWVEV